MISHFKPLRLMISCKKIQFTQAQPHQALHTGEEGDSAVTKACSKSLDTSQAIFQNKVL